MKMAKPIECNQTLRDKAAKKFVERFLTNVKYDPDKIDRDKKALHVYQNMKVVR